MHYIYHLYAYGSDRIYIGKSVNPDVRLKQHVRKAVNSSCRSVLLDWIRAYGPSNISMKIIAGPFETKSEAFAEEIKLISEARKLGVVLANDPRTNGGEDPPNHTGMRRSAETIEKMRTAQKAAWKRTEVRENNRLARTGLKRNRSSVEKMKKTLTGRKHSKQSRENMRQAQLRRYAVMKEQS